MTCFGTNFSNAAISESAPELIAKKKPDIPVRVRVPSGFHSSMKQIAHVSDRELINSVLWRR